MTRMPELLQELYEKLWRAFGPQGWWPGETPFEVALGAILTQNTNWTNVARVMAGLKSDGSLDPQVLLDLPEDVEPAYARHGDIRDHSIGGLFFKNGKPLLAAGRGPHTIACLGQAELDHPPQARIVIDQQYRFPFHGFRFLLTGLKSYRHKENRTKSSARFTSRSVSAGTLHCF